jgi:hypothetical protein
VEPAATVTLAGTVTAGLLLESDTTAPLGARAVRVTVAVMVDPPSTELADNTTLDNAAIVAVAVVGESAHPDAAMHTRSNAAPARAPTDRERFKPTTVHRRAKIRLWCGRTATKVWQRREDSLTKKP